jgi:hypothetical protein
MLDAYSKIVLTVIAVALVAIAAQMFTVPAQALSDGCGESYLDACWVKITDF